MTMNSLLIIAMLILLFLVLLPFWLATPGRSRDRRLIKELFHPGSRRYSLLLPMDYDDNKSYPLVLALHYSGHGLPFYGEIFLTNFIEPALKSLGAIIVAPDCPTKDWAMPESQEYIQDLLAYLGEIYQYDSHKVVIVGYSMGGIGVWYLTEHMSNFLTCGVIISAKPPKVVSESAGEVPLYIIHGREDELFPVIDTNRAVLELESQDRVVVYRIIERATHFETHKFIPALQDAVPWILNQWGMSGGN